MRNKLVALALVFAAPAFAEGELFSADDLERMPDERARLAAEALARSFVKDDKAAFLKLVPKDGMKRAGRAVPRNAVEALLKSQGLAKFAGFEANCEGRTRCVWDLWHANVSEDKKRVEVLHGSGYGTARVAVLTQMKSGAWMLTSLEDVDYGEP